MILRLENKNILKEMFFSGNVVVNKGGNRLALGVAAVSLLVLTGGLMLFAVGQTELLENVTDLTGLSAELHTAIIVGIGGVGAAGSLVYIIVKFVREKSRIATLLSPPEDAPDEFKEAYQHLVRVFLNPDAPSGLSSGLVSETNFVEQQSIIDIEDLLRLRNEYQSIHCSSMLVNGNPNDRVELEFEENSNDQSFIILQTLIPETLGQENLIDKVFVLRGNSRGEVTSITRLFSVQGHHVQFQESKKAEGSDKISVNVTLVQ